MADTGVSVESVEVTLLSEIGMSSAILMKDAYQPLPGNHAGFGPSVPHSQSPSSHEEGLSGPNAIVYVTKIATRTPDEVIEHILLKNPDSRPEMAAHDFHTVILMMSMRLGDPSTTRFINGTIDVAFPPGITILDYSPKDKGTISAIIENGGNAISLSRSLVFLPSAAQGRKTHREPEENWFGITVGPGEQITGAYSKKTGYSFDIPTGLLLEYQGMLKNEHDMFWEIFPPMPPADMEGAGKEMLAVFSLIVKTPGHVPPGITVHIEGRVKGNLWGVIPIKGSVVLP